MNTTEIGKYGEKLAAKYLRKNKYKILEMNIHEAHNEIDIIAANKEFLVFVEVKTRSYAENTDFSYGTPAEAVTKQKQKRIIAAAHQYIRENQSSKHIKKQPRIDVIEVYLSKETHTSTKINHIINAFQ